MKLRRSELERTHKWLLSGDAVAIPLLLGQALQLRAELTISTRSSERVCDSQNPITSPSKGSIIPKKQGTCKSDESVNASNLTARFRFKSWSRASPQPIASVTQTYRIRECDKTGSADFEALPAFANCPSAKMPCPSMSLHVPPTPLKKEWAPGWRPGPFRGEVVNYCWRSWRTLWGAWLAWASMAMPLCCRICSRV